MLAPNDQPSRESDSFCDVGRRNNMAPDAILQFTSTKVLFDSEKRSEKKRELRGKGASWAANPVSRNPTTLEALVNPNFLR